MSKSIKNFIVEIHRIRIIVCIRGTAMAVPRMQTSVLMLVGAAGALSR